MSLHLTFVANRLFTFRFYFVQMYITIPNLLDLSWICEQLQAGILSFFFQFCNKRAFLKKFLCEKQHSIYK